MCSTTTQLSPDGYGTGTKVILRARVSWSISKQRVNLRKVHAAEVGLPWKESHPVFPDNYHLSERRLMMLLTRLRKEPDILQKYDNVIREQLKERIVEGVDEHEAEEIGKVHCLHTTP